MQFVWFRGISLRVLKFKEIKEGWFSFWGEPIFQNVWIIFSPLLYLSLKSPMDQNSSSFIRFQFIVHESGRLFWESWSFYKLRRMNLISGGNQFCRISELFVPPFCISILKVLSTQILHHLLDFSPFCMNQEDEGGPNFWEELILQNVWIIWSPLLYFNFKSFPDPNSSSFIAFQCILHDSGVRF